MKEAKKIGKQTAQKSEKREDKYDKRGIKHTHKDPHPQSR
jgi:hypothetical protein